MTYREPSQALANPLNKILEGIEELNQAIAERIKNGREWKDEHLEELNETRKDLLDWELRLRKLEQDNW